MREGVDIHVMCVLQGESTSPKAGVLESLMYKEVSHNNVVCIQTYSSTGLSSCEIIFSCWTFNFMYFVGRTITNLRSQENIDVI